MKRLTGYFMQSKKLSTNYLEVNEFLIEFVYFIGGKIVSVSQCFVTKAG